jgi:hypothetical protein
VSENEKPNEATQETDFLVVNSVALLLDWRPWQARRLPRPRSDRSPKLMSPSQRRTETAMRFSFTRRRGPVCSSGRMSSGCAPRCASSRDGSQPTGTRCSSQIRSIATGKAAVFDNPSGFDFRNPADTAKLPPLIVPLNVPGVVEKDAVADVAFLHAQKEVDRTKKIGTQRYCMGAPLVVKTAAAVRDRIAAGTSAQWRDRGARWNHERETGKGRSA